MTKALPSTRPGWRVRKASSTFGKSAGRVTGFGPPPWPMEIGSMAADGGRTAEPGSGRMNDTHEGSARSWRKALRNIPNIATSAESALDDSSYRVSVVREKATLPASVSYTCQTVVIAPRALTVADVHPGWKC